jgi:hypothetical protein
MSSDTQFLESAGPAAIARQTQPKPRRIPESSLLAASFRLTLAHSSSYAYTARLATSPEDIVAAQSLRYKVFNLELGEGLVDSRRTQLDADPFDEICDPAGLRVPAEKVSGEVSEINRQRAGEPISCIHAATAPPRPGDGFGQKGNKMGG